MNKPAISSWQRWLGAPQTLWLRRLLFQVHLWLGIGFGLYVVMICITGSAFVLSPLFQQWFVPSEVPAVTASPLSGTALSERIASVYSGYEVVDSMVSSVPEQAVYVTLQQNGQESTRFFDPYSGEDLGDPFPWQVTAIDALVNLHDDLLLGRTGRQLNAVGGALFLFMAITGLLIWWQGKSRWHEGLLIGLARGRSFNWQLHSFIGFWSLFLIIAWGVSAIYFAFPAPFNALIDALDNDLEDFERPDGLLRLLTTIHLARFDSTGLRLLWAFFGMLPVVLFITGFLVWWKRVIRRRG